MAITAAKEFIKLASSNPWEAKKLLEENKESIFSLFQTTDEIIAFTKEIANSTLGTASTIFLSSYLAEHCHEQIANKLCSAEDVIRLAEANEFIAHPLLMKEHDKLDKLFKSHKQFLHLAMASDRCARSIIIHDMSILFDLFKNATIDQPLLQYAAKQQEMNLAATIVRFIPEWNLKQEQLDEFIQILKQNPHIKLEDIKEVEKIKPETNFLTGICNTALSFFSSLTHSDQPSAESKSHLNHNSPNQNY